MCRDFAVKRAAIITRRAVVFGGLSALCSHLVTLRALAVQPTTSSQTGSKAKDYFCLASDIGGVSAGDYKLNDTSGSSHLNLLVAELMEDVAKAYKFIPSNLPGLGYAHGSPEREMGAWVERRSYVPNTTTTLVLGPERVTAEYTSDKYNGSIGLALLLAHEMAHVYQLNATLVDQVEAASTESTRILELHADWLAGWVVGSNQNWSTNALNVASERVRAWGDACVQAVTHHGFPFERDWAMASGIANGGQGLQFSEVSKVALTNVTAWVATRAAGYSVCQQR
jgi:hypothetical protein